MRLAVVAVTVLQVHPTDLVVTPMRLRLAPVSQAMPVAPRQRVHRPDIWSMTLMQMLSLRWVAR